MIIPCEEFFPGDIVDFKTYDAPDTVFCGCVMYADERFVIFDMLCVKNGNGFKVDFDDEQVVDWNNANIYEYVINDLGI